MHIGAADRNRKQRDPCWRSALLVAEPRAGIGRVGLQAVAEPWPGVIVGSVQHGPPTPEAFMIIAANMIRKLDGGARDPPDVSNRLVLEGA